MPDERSIDRRRAIKGAAAAAAGLVVWSEPTIRGLARRPAFASTGSVPIVTNFVGFNDTYTVGSQPAPGEVLDSQVIDGVTISVVINGAGNMRTISITTDDAGCVCGIAGGTAVLTNTAANAQSFGSLVGGAMEFTLPAEFIVGIGRIDWQLTVACV